MKRLLATPENIVWLLLFILLTQGISGEEKEITRLKEVVKDTSYKNYWERLRAIKRLGHIGNLESTVILSDLLDDKEPPIREATVHALKNLSDKPAINYLSTKSLFHPSNALIRANAAWSLGLIRSEETLSYLIKSLNDADWSVRARAIRAIGQLPNSSSAAGQIIKRFNDPAWQVRTAAISVLGQMNAQDNYHHFVKLLSDSAPEVVSTALDALTQSSSQEASVHLISALKHKDYRVRIAAIENLLRLEPGKTFDSDTVSISLNDPDWRVRAAAIKSLSRVRDKKSVELLIKTLSAEKWRLRYDIACSLTTLTNQALGLAPSTWQSWYEANKDKLVLGNPADLKPQIRPMVNETMATFFEIPIFGQNIIFVIDYSGSMKYKEPDKNDELDDGKEKKKIDIAITELENTLKRFRSEMRFNIVIMSTEALTLKKRKLAPKLLPATEPDKISASQFVRSLWDKLEDIKRGRGDLYDALMEAFAEPEVDTLFLLSDGRATYGTYIIDENILENLKIENRFRQIVIHTILTGTKGINPKLMENIAEFTGGMFMKK
jgi:HEAT repeat protein